MKVVFKPTKISVIIAILNSHRIVKRQIRHFRNMHLPDDIEIIFIDDGSDPPLSMFNEHGVPNLQIYPTNDYRPWTQGLARNLGAKIALGEYVFFTDIDHILSYEALMAVHEFHDDKMEFPRHFGILDHRGNITQDVDILLQFGLSKARYKKHKLGAGYHTNTFAMKKSLFVELDGFNPRYCTSRFHVGGKYMSEERDFYLKFRRHVKAGLAHSQVLGPPINVYPIGRFQETGNENPFGLFHGASRVQEPQPLLEGHIDAVSPP
jgi:glycosyltransferase involved in cell wall biosynthesis